MAEAPTRFAIPLRSNAEQRGSERFDVSMPVHVEGATGVTHDLSSSGLSFESPRPYASGDRLDVVIDYLLDGHNYPLKCYAIVIRCERDGEKYRVGARLLTPVSDAPDDHIG